MSDVTLYTRHVYEYVYVYACACACVCARVRVRVRVHVHVYTLPTVASLVSSLSCTYCKFIKHRQKGAFFFNLIRAIFLRWNHTFVFGPLDDNLLLDIL